MHTLGHIAFALAFIGSIVLIEAAIIGGRQ